VTRCRQLRRLGLLLSDGGPVAVSTLAAEKQRGERGRIRGHFHHAAVAFWSIYLRRSRRGTLTAATTDATTATATATAAAAGFCFTTSATAAVLPRGARRTASHRGPTGTGGNPRGTVGDQLGTVGTGEEHGWSPKAKQAHYNYMCVVYVY